MGYHQTQNLVLPDSWEIVELGKICKIKSKCIPPGATIFPKRGAAIATNKKRLLQNYAILDPNLIAIIPGKRILPEFLYYYFLTVDLTSLTDPGCLPQLNKKDLEPFYFSLPPLGEQKKIAAVLSLVQEAIRQQEQLITTATELKKATMQKLFTEGTRGELQKMTEIGLVPESWDVVKLNKLTNDKLQNGAFIKNPEIGKGFLFANVVDIYRGIYLDFSKLERISVSKSEIQKYLLEDGDILVVRSSLKREGIGQNCIANNVNELAFFDCHLIRVKPDKNIIIPEFLSYFWVSTKGKEELIKRSKTTTMTTINQQSLNSSIIPLPKKSEQIKIVDLLLDFEKKVNLIVTKKELLQDLFRTLLHQLMTAQIRVDDLDLSALNLELQGEKQDALV